jgi:putative flippase GtrA
MISHSENRMMIWVFATRHCLTQAAPLRCLAQVLVVRLISVIQLFLVLYKLFLIVGFVVTKIFEVLLIISNASR